MHMTAQPKHRNRKSLKHKIHSEALVASLIASDSPILDELGQLDDLDDDEEDGEEQVDPLSLQSAQSFIELLVKNEKLELVEGETGDEPPMASPQC